MYLRRFGLRKPPFHVTPDPDFLFLSPGHREAIASILYGVEQRKGLVVIAGEVGVGKTTVLRSYLQKADADRFRFISLIDMRTSFRNLVLTINRGLGLSPSSEDLFELVPALHEALLKENRMGRTVALLIDEAQNMPVEALENLGVLSNLETNTQKLIQIVLCGQPELEKKLDTYALRKLKQRIAIRFRIPPLTNKEGVAYIRHRLIKAGHDMGDLFTERAMRMIVRAAGGVPRTINILCDNALVTTYGSHRNRVTSGIVREVLKGQFGNGDPGNLRWRTAGVLVLFLLGAVWLLQLSEDPGFRRIVGIPFGDRAARSVLPDPASRMPPAPELSPAGVSAEEGRGSGETTAPPEGNAGREEPDPLLPSGGAGMPESPAIPTVRSVMPGDTLGTLIREEYGDANAELLHKVLENNPQIRDADRILAGDNIYFPRQAADNRR